MAKQQRIALVIGNSEYRHGALKNPVHDAGLITDRLKALHFEIVGGVDSRGKGTSPGANLNCADMEQLFAKLAQAVQPGATVIVYYAGHGLQVRDQNCLVPIEDSGEGGQQGLGLVKIRDKIDTLAARIGETGTLIVFLDACRNNPLSRQQELKLLELPDVDDSGGELLQGPARVARSLASFKIPARAKCARTFIGFATAPGDVAMDGASDHSPFARALDRHLATRGLEVEELYDRVSKDVLAEVARDSNGGVQDPWSESNLNRRLYLHERSWWPLVFLGLAGLLAGLFICLAIFEQGKIIDLTDRPLVWGMGLLLGAACAGGTWYWGSGGWRDTLFAFAGPGFGFALALAILKLLPDVGSANIKFNPGPGADLAHKVFNGVTLFGGLLYFAGTIIVWFENPPERPRYFLQFLNRFITLVLPFILMFVLYRLQYYVSNPNPAQTVTALFTVVGGGIYAASVALACRGQRGNFSQFGPITGAISIGLMMPAIFAAYSAFTGKNAMDAADSQWLLVGLGSLWHGLLGAQLGYCFTYYVPDYVRPKSA